MTTLAAPRFRRTAAFRTGLFFAVLALAHLPAQPAADERKRAVDALNDVLEHFWKGSAVDGHIVLTWRGYAVSRQPQPQYTLWVRGELYALMYRLYQMTGDATLRQRLVAEWKFIKSDCPPAKLQAVGEHSGTNWACDDAGWSAMLYLAAYQATGDQDALTDAKGVVKNAITRWMDDQLGGGMWYGDEDHNVDYHSVARSKSLYQVGLILSALRIYELTHDKSYLEPAMKCTEWIEGHLRRPDGIYWSNYDAHGPWGGDRPNDIREAGSVSFLGGNMAMGVIDAALFRITVKDEYRKRALGVAAAIRASKEVDANGVLVDDRDAWADGTFAMDWASDVLTLPGIAPEDKGLIQKTAVAVYTKDRTPNGYYGGCWDGPADGPGSVWSRKQSCPQQLMTSANAVDLIVAEAIAAQDPKREPGPACKSPRANN
jgi:predicted alpha-1,6-mannanase (GH76 family)